MRPQLLSAECRTTEGSSSQCVSFAWAALLSLAGLKLSIQQLTGHAMIVHPNNVSHPLQLGLDEYGFNAGVLCTVQDLEVCDTAMPWDERRARM